VCGDIEIHNLSKAFMIRYNKSNSLKSKFVGMFHKRFREEAQPLWVLRDINLTIRGGEVFGVIGKNGSGKSTLLRIMAGIYPPSSGEVRYPRGVRVGTMIDLGVGFHPELTGRENIYLGGSVYGLTHKEIEEMYAAIVDFSELDGFIDTPIKNYSSGMQARLGFALALSLKPGLLLVDEVLAVGDEGFQRKCIGQMNQFKRDGKTIVLVSHDPSTVGSFCDRVCVLDHGNQVYVGTPTEALDVYHKILH